MLMVVVLLVVVLVKAVTAPALSREASLESFMPVT